MKTARSWGVPPRQVVLGEPVQWDGRDSRLSMGFTLLEDETCKSCGTVAWHGHSGDSRITFEHDKQYCWGCAKLEEQRAEDDKNRTAKSYGAKPYVTATMSMSDDPLPSRHQEFERRERLAERNRSRRT